MLKTVSFSPEREKETRVAITHRNCTALDCMTASICTRLVIVGIEQCTVFGFGFLEQDIPSETWSVTSMRRSCILRF